MRPTVAEEKDNVRQFLRQVVDPETMTVTRRDADLLGAYVAGKIQAKITSVQTPANSPATQRRKGSSSPLLDTGFMAGECHMGDHFKSDIYGFMRYNRRMNPCVNCGAELPKGRRKCDACKREVKLAAHRRRYQKIADQQNAKARQRYQDDEAFRSRAKEQAQKWREANPEKRKASRHLNNEKTRLRRANDPEYRERMNAYSRERRARANMAYTKLRNVLYLLEKQAGKCAICGDWLPENRSDVEVDHIIPVVSGGTNEIGNLQLLHRSCNRSKGGK